MILFLKILFINNIKRVPWAYDSINTTFKKIIKKLKIKNIRDGTISFYKQILKNPKSYRTMDKPTFLLY